MTIFFAANEVEALSTFNGTITTAAGVALAGVNRAGFNFSGDTQSGRIDTTPLTEGWFHFRTAFIAAGTHSGSSSNYNVSASLRNANNVAIWNFRPRSRGSSIQSEIVGRPVVEVNSGANTYDIHFRINAVNGFIRVYQDQLLIDSFEGSVQFSSGAQAVSRFHMTAHISNLFSAGQQAYSQLLLADQPTLGALVHTLPLSVGTVNDWTGVVTDINDTSNTPATLVSSATANTDLLMAAGDPAAVLPGNYIAAAIISTAAQAVTGSPVTTLRGRLLMGGTSYTVGAAKSLGNGFSASQFIAEVSPVTAVPFTAAEVNSAEFGFRAEA